MHPFGPFLATPDEIADVYHLRLLPSVNGDIKLDGSTSNLIFKVPFLISYLALVPGDVISTGTPAGVGLGCRPQQFIRNGDVIELGIEGLGTQRQAAVRYQDLNGGII